jgi:hypothetical protein
MKRAVTQTKKFIETNNRFIMPAVLLLGFIVDYFTFNRVDQLFDNLVLLAYVILAAGSLVALYGTKTSARIARIAPFTFQYAIGGLFSGLFIFYFRSGSISVSFPFLIVLFVLMLGSDYFYKRFPKASFQLVVFYVALISYANLVVPTFTKHMSLWTFVGATLLSGAVMYGFVSLLDRPQSLIRGVHRTQVERRLIATTIIFALLYVTNIIPPIPLSMKAGIVGYGITRTSDSGYYVSAEEAPWYLPFSTHGTTLHTRGPVYAFTSIFAPTELETTIIHEWQRFDDTEGWVTTSRIPMNITGGREDGFRGYSLSNNLTPGSWRVTVRTSRGQVVGRIRFEISEDQTQKRTSVVY